MIASHLIESAGIFDFQLSENMLLNKRSISIDYMSTRSYHNTEISRTEVSPTKNKWRILLKAVFIFIVKDSLLILIFIVKDKLLSNPNCEKMK